MADPRKPTNSSMIDLKAELFRKQEEYKQLKAQNSSEFVKGSKSNKPGKGETIWSKKNAGVLQRASKDLAEKEEEDNVMERSRRALEAKSKIYNKIASASGIPDDDGSEGYLVDFQKKAVDRMVEERRGGGEMAATMAAETGGDSRKQGADMSDDDLPSEDPLPLPADPSEEWVDYVDTFGRSRRCMKKDLPHLEKQERPLGRPPGDSGLKLKEGATLLSADMKRELRRQQWEKETEESAKGPVHYANVQYDEIRSHGTGFYQFSKDSNLREEQMEELNKLREQTMDGRQRSERIKEKRKAALEARLAKVKQRRKMKDGSPLDVEDKKEEQQQKTGEDSVPQEAKPLTREDAWRHSAPVREWDVGKEKLPEWNAKRYTEQRRSERENEFAPPQFYFDQKISPGPRGPPGVPHRASRPQTEPGHNQSSQPSVSVFSNTEAMLKQIRQSVGNAGAETGVDLASIPLPQVGSAAENVHSGVSGEKERRGGGSMGKEDKPGVAGVHQWQESAAVSSTGQVQTPLQVQASQQQATMFGGHMLDVSLPPPGYPGNLPVWGQPAGPVPPPHQSLQPSSLTQSSFTSSSISAPLLVSADPSPPCAASFVYPSQQGLLSPRPHPPTPQATTITTNAQSSANPPAVRKAPAVSQTAAVRKAPAVSQTPAVRKAPAVSQTPAAKGGLVDKRFMQNRGVSEEDLLGYMAPSSDDPLTKIQPVAYTPGHFSAQLHKPASSQEAAAAAAEREPKPAGQTEGVIFGVPDFLQPAAVTATSYQPGSFMAAKEAAAQRAEEEYEAARKKTQYSSAPVLYCKPDDDDMSQGGTDTSEEDRLKKPVVAPPADEGDEEYAQFMREVKANK